MQISRNEFDILKQQINQSNVLNLTVKRGTAMKRKTYYSIALAFVSLFASSLLAGYLKLTLPAFFLGMAIWFCAVGVSANGKSEYSPGRENILKVFALVVSFCMNIAIAAAIVLCYDHNQSGKMIYVDYWTCLLYGLMISAVGIVAAAVCLAIYGKKSKSKNS